MSVHIDHTVPCKENLMEPTLFDETENAALYATRAPLDVENDLMRVELLRLRKENDRLSAVLASVAAERDRLLARVGASLDDGKASVIKNVGDIFPEIVATREEVLYFLPHGVVNKGASWISAEVTNDELVLRGPENLNVRAYEDKVYVRLLK